jgi:coenzyme Q-binding protein COQ10
MTTYTEKRNLPYTPEQLFALVADVEHYPDFLPWCKDCRITHKEEGDNVFFADLIIGYKMIRELFGSKITLKVPHHIHVEYISGPMKYLSNYWTFQHEEDGSCTIDFFVDFEFKSKLLQNLMGMFFSDIVRHMVKAFEDRAESLYGANGLGQEVKSFIAS